MEAIIYLLNIKNIGLGGLRLHLYLNTCFGILRFSWCLWFSCCNLDPGWILFFLFSAKKFWNTSTSSVHVVSENSSNSNFDRWSKGVECRYVTQRVFSDIPFWIWHWGTWTFKLVTYCYLPRAGWIQESEKEWCRVDWESDPGNQPLLLQQLHVGIS